MSGTARMSGIPYRPKDDVPKHGETEPVFENQPEPVFYDKDGIVYPTDRNYPKAEVTKPAVYPPNKTNVNTVVVPAVGPDTNVPTYAPIETTETKLQVTNAKTVSTETVAEARAAAKARKVK